MLGASGQIDLLGAPDRRRGEVFIHAGAEDDVVAFEETLGPFHLLIKRTEGRATISGDIGRRVEPGCGIALALHHRQAHKGLSAVEKDAPGFQRIFVVETYLIECGGRCGHVISLPSEHTQNAP